MPFTLRYHPDVKAKDLPVINAKMKIRIRNAIEHRLATEPHQYGEPLRKTLRGYWKLRIGDYRVVFKIVGEDALILGIIHKMKVHEAIEKRG